MSIQASLNAHYSALQAPDHIEVKSVQLGDHPGCSVEVTFRNGVPDRLAVRLGAISQISVTVSEREASRISALLRAPPPKVPLKPKRPWVKRTGDWMRWS